MENKENTTIEGLGESAQEALRQAYAERGVYYDKSQETMKSIAFAGDVAIQGVMKAVEAIGVAVLEAISLIVEAFKSLLGEAQMALDEEFWMVPPHVKHLAYNHPKARVRNKNWTRMWKIRERYLKCHKT